MTEVPKIVYDRLRAARSEQALPGQTEPEPAHPDADLLTAFAEHSLSAPERDGMLEHLALCRDCREVVALALPDAGLAAVLPAANTETARATAVPTKSHWSWLSSPKLAWPTLRWVALAAGIAVAASVLLFHPGKLNQAMLPSANRQVAPAAQPAAGTQIASSPLVPSPVAPSPVVPSPMTSSSTDQSLVSAKALSVKTDAPRTKPGLRPSQKLKAGPAVPSSGQVQSGMLLAYNRNGSSQGDQPPRAPSASTPAFESGESARPAVTESVEVAGAAVAKETETSSLMARNVTPAIEKAKPAPQETDVIGQQKPQGVCWRRLGQVTGQECDVCRETGTLPKPDFGSQCQVGDRSRCPAAVT